MDRLRQELSQKKKIPGWSFQINASSVGALYGTWFARYSDAYTKLKKKHSKRVKKKTQTESHEKDVDLTKCRRIITLPGFCYYGQSARCSPRVYIDGA